VVGKIAAAVIFLEPDGGGKGCIKITSAVDARKTKTCDDTSNKPRGGGVLEQICEECQKMTNETMQLLSCTAMQASGKNHQSGEGNKTTIIEKLNNGSLPAWQLGKVTCCGWQQWQGPSVLPSPQRRGASLRFFLSCFCVAFCTTS